MKIKIFNTRGKFSPTLYLGKLMWRCRDGSPHYATEYNISAHVYRHCYSDKIYPFPALYILRWHRGIISSIDDLGIISHSISVGIEWWNFQYSIMFLKSKHTKTTEEINKTLVQKKLDTVL
jgi:hypothetical protein